MPMLLIYILYDIYTNTNDEDLNISQSSNDLRHSQLMSSHQLNS